MITTILNLTNCPKSALDNLPENMEVRGGLDISWCESLKFLPEDLKVGGGLNLSECTNLESLPKNLKVRGKLSLINCESLTSLSKDLKVGGIIHINFYDDEGTGVGKKDFPKRLWKQIYD